MIVDEFNTNDKILSLLRYRGMLDKLSELENRGIGLTPFQANLLFLNGRGYGKTYLSMIKGAEFILENLISRDKLDITIDQIGKSDPDFGASRNRDKNYFIGFISFLEEYYCEIEILNYSYSSGILTIRMKDK